MSRYLDDEDPKPTEDDIDQVAAAVEGTCTPIYGVLESLEMEHLDACDVEEALSEREIDMCPNCGWWFTWDEMDDGGFCFECSGIDDL